ncbi:MAG: hypothetical protein R2939_20065 [Kofleriaceae bacterium]
MPARERPRRRFGLTAAVTASLLFAPALAAAQPDLVDPEEELREEALEIARRAFAEQQRKNYVEADRLYRQAYCRYPDPQTVFNLATVARSRGEVQSAAELFTLYLELDPNGPLSGDARVILGKLGVKGTLTSASIACAKRPTPTSIDPVDEPDPPVTAKPIDPTPPPPPPAPRASTGGGALRWVGLATTIVGLGAAGGGVYFGLEAQRHSDNITNNTGPWTPELLAEQQLGEDAERNQIILLSAGGVATVAGVIMMIVGWPDDDERPRGGVAVTPLVQPGVGGLVLSGGF